MYGWFNMKTITGHREKWHNPVNQCREDIGLNLTPTHLLKTALRNIVIEVTFLLDEGHLYKTYNLIYTSQKMLNFSP